MMVILMTSCISREHNMRLQNMEGYVSNIVDRYYSSVQIDFSDYMSGSTCRNGHTFTQTEDNAWLCEIHETKDDVLGWKYSDINAYSDVTVQISQDGTSFTYIIQGTCTEDDYITTIKTLGEGIKDDVGILRVEIYQNGSMLGWGEASLSKYVPGTGNNSTTIETGE